MSDELYLLSGDLGRGVSTPKVRQEASQRIAPGIEPCVGVKELIINGRPSSLSKGFGPEWEDGGRQLRGGALEDLTRAALAP